VKQKMFDSYRIKFRITENCFFLPFEIKFSRFKITELRTMTSGRCFTINALFKVPVNYFEVFFGFKTELDVMVYLHSKGDEFW
jgi:hypothetical protein